MTRYRPGPGMMVSAAFIGPGTVTTCTLAGANFGFALLWALVFATVTTIFLQSLAVRVALATDSGLAAAILNSVRSPVGRALAGTLLFAALVIGNAAYEAGNITGAALGAEAALGTANRTAIVLALATTAAVVLFAAKTALIERLLIGLVVFMSAAFLVTFAITSPSWEAIAAGLVPRIPEGGLLTAIALIGTTIVPYNLFLHAARARERWSDPKALGEAYLDTGLSIGLGGLVSMAIVATAAAALAGSSEVTNAVDMAQQLGPVFGAFSALALGAGLFAAGLTSAITAPLATAYVVRELVGSRGTATDNWVFRGTMAVVLLSGVAGALSGSNPVEIILFAQVANGLLLPVVAFFLIRLIRDRALLGRHAAGPTATAASVLILLITTGLGLRLIARALGWWP